MPEEKGDKSKNLIWIFLLLTMLSIIFAVVKLSFSLWFWVILLVWIAIWLLYYFSKIFKVMLYFWVVVIIWLVFSSLISSGVIMGSKKTSSGNSTSDLPVVNGIKLSDCTSTSSDKPEMLDGWKVTIYSAPLLVNGSNEVSNSNSVKTFSYSGIKNKTDANSLHIRFEKSDGGYITGYQTTMELCNQDNKANYSYVTKYQGDDGAGSNSVASINYLHGGSYLYGPGLYRADAYIKDLNGVWHLVDRMSDIQITE